LLLELTEPEGVVTVIGPVVAPDGTVTTSWVAVAELTSADVPLKVTVFWLNVVLNPVPKMVTVAFTAPLPGVNLIIESWLEFCRDIERMLPTAS
jgi:hypothetical protein